MREALGSVVNSLIYAIPLLLIILVVTKVIGSKLDQKRVPAGKIPMATGKGFINFYCGVVLIVGVFWVIITIVLAIR